ncbi:MAG: transcription elongation factor GreA [Holosporales bacterium]|jgi:transcription elongation factor GreA|nr:transcription elongation factor GreA [Holosporales bacterium]
MAQKLPMTERGFRQLQEELKTLKTVGRPQVIKDIADARRHGDLSENAEYHAAREKQGFIESRILEIEDRISRAEVIDISKLSGTQIFFGATVTLMDEETEDKIVYQIVGEDEADIKAGRLSIDAPLARSLVGKIKGDVLEVVTPRGHKSYEILGVSYV